VAEARIGEPGPRDIALLEIAIAQVLTWIALLFVFLICNEAARISY
jgi:hypothetical protein